MSISSFALLFCVPVSVTSSAVGLKTCTINTRIEKYKSIVKKQRTRHDERVLLRKTKLDTTEVLILTQSYISHDDFILVSNVKRIL